MTTTFLPRRQARQCTRFMWCLFLANAAHSHGISQTPPHIPAEQEVAQRSTKLLREMTVDEKIGQMSQLFLFGHSTQTEERIKKGEVGSLLFITDPSLINRMQHIAVDQSRLHVPLIFGFDVIHGFRTIFPAPIAMAASWDPSSAEKAQSVAAEEARSVGIEWSFAPMVDIARDPRWGRIVEGAGEDPFLGSAFARAQVRGFQGEYVGSPGHILACVKHFAGYGAAEGGRDYDAAYVPESELRNVYLPPFDAAVKAGVGTVMSAYMDLNDVPATGNHWLLTDVLRDEWKFKGFVVSDADAVKNLRTHGYAATSAEAALKAFVAGVNMEMAVGSTTYSTGLEAALKDGSITEAQLDAAVMPILESKLKLGLFDHPYVDEEAAKTTLQNPGHRDAARTAAERSAVLLRNEGALLPLKHDTVTKLAVLGPMADSKLDLLGPWALAADPEETITVLDGLKREAGAQSVVRYAQGVQLARKYPSPFDMLVKSPKVSPWTESQSKEELDRAVQLARDSDIAVLVLGEAQNMSGEAASTSTLDLPGREEELLEAVVATGKPVIVVLINGRPLNLTWASTHVGAILEAWYPGTQGGAAIANLLYGDAVPGGKLPFTWPRNVGQVPIYYAHNTTHEPAKQGKRYWNEESTPLYPFGYGLSYAKFAFANLHVSKETLKRGESLTATVDIENVSDIAGDEVAQLYLHQQSGSSSRPVRQLTGFERISLAPHEKKTVRFFIGPEELTYWSSPSRSWIQDTAAFDLWAGEDSSAELHSSFSVVP
jgi:beta-glucosidase